jgi:predicted regulator of Ras-like GTPase activity (Roadblock/LC7/MglB family)
MIGEDLDRMVKGLRGPMAEFVAQSRVRTAMLLSHSGQVLAQHGFARRLDITNVAALAAATHVSAHALAELVGAGSWAHLHHAGHESQIFLAPFRCGEQDLVLVAIFDQDTTLGLVQLFFDRLVGSVSEVAERYGPRPSQDGRAFEHDLEVGLDHLLNGRER